jgi:hypothetical protein
MAKIKLTAPIADIRGQLSGVVYSNWKGSPYVRSMASAVSNPNSLFQERIRAALANLSKYWLSTLDDAQRAAWEEYAKERGSAFNAAMQKGYQDIVPALGKIMSGKNAFIALNTQLARSDIALVEDAPLGINAPGQPAGVGATFVAGPPVKITIDWTDPADLEAGGKCSVWGECAGVFHRQIVATVDKAAETLDVTAMRGAGGVSLTIVKGLYRFQVVAWDTHGQRSAGSQLITYNYA